MESHFENKDALSHVMAKRREGMLSISEAHGMEMPGAISAATDASKECVVALLFLFCLLTLLHVPASSIFISLLVFGLGWVTWKGGRSARLGWARLERLHRLIEQEKYEIEHHRPQEREELVALYKTKGFEGKLLEEVVDVLMADQDRLLKVMLEEEMGLTLQAHEHPLQQALGATIGALVSVAVSCSSLFFFPHIGMWLAVFIMLTVSVCLEAQLEKNKWIPSLIWTYSIAVLGFGVLFFLFKSL